MDNFMVEKISACKYWLVRTSVGKYYDGYKNERFIADKNDVFSSVLKATGIDQMIRQSDLFESDDINFYYHSV